MVPHSGCDNAAWRYKPVHFSHDLWELSAQSEAPAAPLHGLGAASGYTINYPQMFAATQFHMGQQLPSSAHNRRRWGQHTVADGVRSLDFYGWFRIMGLFGGLGLCLIYPLFLWVLASPVHADATKVRGVR